MPENNRVVMLPMAMPPWELVVALIYGAAGEPERQHQRSSMMRFSPPPAIGGTVMLWCDDVSTAFPVIGHVLTLPSGVLQVMALLEVEYEEDWDGAYKAMEASIEVDAGDELDGSPQQEG